VSEQIDPTKMIITIKPALGNRNVSDLASTFQSFRSSSESEPKFVENKKKDLEQLFITGPQRI